MKTYSVKQIAEMLDTNPETVRRWIRDNKLKAIQVSRKDGNVVTDDDLRKFLKATPKYMAKTAPSLVATTVASPVVGIAALASAILAGAIAGYYDGKSKNDVQVTREDLKKYLEENRDKISIAIRQKKNLIAQTQTEIEELEKQIAQYNYLIENDGMITDAVKKTKKEEE